MTLPHSPRRQMHIMGRQCAICEAWHEVNDIAVEVRRTKNATKEGPSIHRTILWLCEPCWAHLASACRAVATSRASQTAGASKPAPTVTSPADDCE